MESPTQTTTSEITRDLSPEWLKLIARIRALSRQAIDDPTAARSKELARESLRLCRHVERLHADVESLLGGAAPPEPEEATRTEDRHEALTDEEKEALKIQREIHEPSSIRQVIKALFLWQDYPEERLEEEESSSAPD